MGYLYVVIDDPSLKQMVLIQGCLSIGLLVASLYFRTRLDARDAEQHRIKKEQESK